jgi:di/tricarboxylate transporter
MNLAWVSVGALVCAVALSCTTSLNIGIISLTFAWIVGVYLGGMPFADVMAGFPSPLFATLVGVTLFFSMAEINGTLERLTARAVRLCRGHAGLIGVMFFLVAVFISSIGPGSIATAALLAPPAMAVAQRSGIPPLLMAIMVGNGALAGTLSPFAPTGIVAYGVMARVGLSGLEWQTYWNNLAAHAVVAFGGYYLLGGWRLFVRTERRVVQPPPAAERFAASHWLTIGIIAALIVSVIGFGTNVGLTAMAGASLLSMARAADEQAAIRKMPWGVILMVSGVTVLIALTEKTQGLDLFTELLVRLSTSESVTGVVAFVTGLVSVYSSTSGVVLPAFIPTVPGLAARLGGLDPLMLASAMAVGASLVDLSPLSTTGALCLAALPEGADARRLFNQLLAWGLSMTLVGAVVCWVMFGLAGL